MKPERPELRIIRESLEALVAPSMVSSAIFEALEAIGGDLAQGGAAASEFVQGPLRDALARRMGADAHPVIDDVLAMIGAVTPSGPGAVRRGGDVTREVFVDSRPVIVIVVSAGHAFASKLQAALGATRVIPIPAASLERMDEQLRVAAPQMVLVDSADFAPIEPERLALFLEKLPATTVRAIWGADLPYGGAVLRAMITRSIPATPLDRREGIDPVLDLIRSRQLVR
ncbi:hypothetical protein [Sandaracinus amylolyticus]|nr:hypothetical protein [Sandaracinus amylolyticus]